MLKFCTPQKNPDVLKGYRNGTFGWNGSLWDCITGALINGLMYKVQSDAK